MGGMKTLVLLFAPALFAATPTVDDARKFLDQAEKNLLTLSTEASRADWVRANFITFDTESISALADERQIAESVRLAKGATRFDSLKLPPDIARKMTLLKVGLVLAAPSNPAESAEVTQLGAGLEGLYGKGKYCRGGSAKCLDIEDITRIMANSTDAKELLDAWTGWH